MEETPEENLSVENKWRELLTSGNVSSVPPASSHYEDWCELIIKILKENPGLFQHIQLWDERGEYKAYIPPKKNK